jgi:hypothetical protein
VSPLTLDVGDVPMGERSAPQLVTVRNDGTRRLRIGTITKAGANPDQFAKPALKDGCSGVALIPSASCTVAVRFQPSRSGVQNATLVIRSNDPDENPVTVLLSGTGQPPEVAVTPLLLDFGSVPAGTSSPVLSVVVQNLGAATLSVGTITKGGTDPGQFGKPATKDACSGKTLGPTQACTIGVRFKPTSEGARSATLLIPSNDPDDDPVTVTLTGTGSTS